MRFASLFAFAFAFVSVQLKWMLAMLVAFRHTLAFRGIQLFVWAACLFALTSTFLLVEFERL